MTFRHIALVLFVLIAGVSSERATACSACGCTLSSDWSSQGLASSNGWRIDGRFDFFDQDELRSGTSSVARSTLEIPAEREIQQFTLNRNYSLAADYSPNKNWGVSFVLPWFDRAHATIAEGDSTLSTSHDQGIGDMRVLARYSGFDAQRSTGIEFGLKFPTGNFSDRFASGPQQGEIVDRGLQLGSGTTDLLLGVYNFGALADDWSYFAQALLQQSLEAREGFKPGLGANFNVGLRYTASTTFVPQLQLNARVEKREAGVNADVENSGATLVYVSPGVTWNFSRRFSAYTFVQVPLLQRVNGLQIEARWLGSVGLHYIF